MAPRAEAQKQSACGALRVDDSFDVEAAIAEFLTDPARVTLELPYMTTVQRQRAKQLAAQHSELTCESYGLGCERKLHVFKRAGNTDGAGGNAVCPDSCGRRLPTLLEDLQVRNTFIHFEAKPIDERAVQSMPHGMFKQCLQAEPAKYKNTEGVGTGEAPLMTTPLTSPLATATPAGGCSLAAGSEVVIDGLQKLPVFNGLRGVVQGFDEESGRYSVLLVSPAIPGGHQLAKVKQDNLRSAMPPKPWFAPTLSQEHGYDLPGADSFVFRPTPVGQGIAS